jgi:hypothetical protein
MVCGIVVLSLYLTPDDISEEILRAEIITEARSLQCGKPLTGSPISGIAATL